MTDGAQTSDLQVQVAQESGKDVPSSFSFYDIFFWRDAPDWYRKTFLSAGFGLCYCTLKQYLNRHELEVFMPPRSKVLPETMQEGYRNSQMLKYGFLKVGGEVTSIAGAAATYYAGAYYLGRYRGVHSYENFALSGALAGGGVALWLIRPFKPRTTLFGVLLGGAMGAAGAYPTQYFGLPHWDESHDFEGYFLGSRVNLKKKDGSTEIVEAGAASPASAKVLEAASATVAALRGSERQAGSLAPAEKPPSVSSESPTGTLQAPSSASGLPQHPSSTAQSPGPALQDALNGTGISEVKKKSWWRLW